MKAAFILLFAFFLLVAPVTSCKKESKKADPPQDSLPTLKGCLMLSDTRSVFGKQEITEYNYDEKGSLTQINFYLQPGKTLIEKKELRYNTEGLLNEYTWTTSRSDFGNSSRFLIKLYYNKGSKNAAFADFYDLEGKPSPILLRKFTMLRTDDNVLQKIIEETPLTVSDIEFTYNFEYNAAGNVSRIIIAPSGDHTPFRYEFGDYDTKSKSAANIPEAMFLNLPITNVLAWATALSKNNPGFVDALEANYTGEMTYEYNDKGYPTSRKDSVTTPTRNYTENHVFGYKCK